MATRVNRAANAANKRTGRHKHRNPAAANINSHLPLDSPLNQEVFRESVHESVVRMHNETTGLDLIPSTLKISGTFANHRGEFKSRHTAEGEGFSPHLTWNSVSPRTAELILLCEDLDAHPSIVHWLVYRISPSVREIPEGVPHGDQITSVLGTPLQGKNSLGITGYTPPSLTQFDNWHHYRFRLIELDSSPRNLRPGMTKEELMTEIKPFIIHYSDYICRYRRESFKAG